MGSLWEHREIPQGGAESKAGLVETRKNQPVASTEAAVSAAAGCFGLFFFVLPANSKGKSQAHPKMLEFSADSSRHQFISSLKLKPL